MPDGRAVIGEAAERVFGRASWEGALACFSTVLVSVTPLCFSASVSGQNRVCPQAELRWGCFDAELRVVFICVCCSSYLHCVGAVVVSSIWCVSLRTCHGRPRFCTRLFDAAWYLVVSGGRRRACVLWCGKHLSPEACSMCSIWGSKKSLRESHRRAHNHHATGKRCGSEHLAVC